MCPFDLTAQLARSRRSMELEGHAVREDYLPGGVGNAAVLGLGEALTAWIVGVDEGVVRPIVERSRDWLLDSVARDEQFGESPAAFAAVRIEALAVASWALGETSHEYYRVALDLQDEALAALGLPDVQIRDGYLEDYLVDCALAGEHQRGIDACGRYGAAIPSAEADLTTPLELAAWICGGGIRVCAAEDDDPARRPDDAPAPGGRAARLVDPRPASRVLRDSLGGWLSHGGGITAAAWTQLVFCAPRADPDASAAFSAVRALLRP